MTAPRLWIGKTFYRKINQPVVDGPRMLGQAGAIPPSADSLSGGMRKCSAADCGTGKLPGLDYPSAREGCRRRHRFGNVYKLQHERLAILLSDVLFRGSLV